VLDTANLGEITLDDLQRARKAEGSPRSSPAFTDFDASSGMDVDFFGSYQSSFSPRSFGVTEELLQSETQWSRMDWSIGSQSEFPLESPYPSQRSELPPPSRASDTRGSTRSRLVSSPAATVRPKGDKFPKAYEWKTARKIGTEPSMEALTSMPLSPNLLHYLRSGMVLQWQDPSEALRKRRRKPAYSTSSGLDRAASAPGLPGIL